jgi:hypothetical protein
MHAEAQAAASGEVTYVEHYCYIAEAMFCRMAGLNEIALGGVIDILVDVEAAPPNPSGRVSDRVYVLTA